MWPHSCLGLKMYRRCRVYEATRYFGSNLHLFSHACWILSRVSFLFGSLQNSMAVAYHNCEILTYQAVLSGKYYSLTNSPIHYAILVIGYHFHSHYSFLLHLSCYHRGDGSLIFICCQKTRRFYVFYSYNWFLPLSSLVLTSSPFLAVHSDPLNFTRTSGSCVNCPTDNEFFPISGTTLISPNSLFWPFCVISRLLDPSVCSVPCSCSQFPRSRSFFA